MYLINIQYNTIIIVCTRGLHGKLSPRENQCQPRRSNVDSLYYFIKTRGSYNNNNINTVNAAYSGLFSKCFLVGNNFHQLIDFPLQTPISRILYLIHLLSIRLFLLFFFFLDAFWNLNIFLISAWILLKFSGPL